MDIMGNFGIRNLAAWLAFLFFFRVFSFSSLDCIVGMEVIASTCFMTTENKVEIREEASRLKRSLTVK